MKLFSFIAIGNSFEILEFKSKQPGNNYFLEWGQDIGRLHTYQLSKSIISF